MRIFVRVLVIYALITAAITLVVLFPPPFVGAATRNFLAKLTMDLAVPLAFGMFIAITRGNLSLFRRAFSRRKRAGRPEPRF
jgi:membrane protein implicated in regulation of membrane protease activity